MNEPVSFPTVTATLQNPPNAAQQQTVRADHHASLDRSTDLELVKAVRHDRSCAAFTELYRRYCQTALAVARSISSADPDDLVAEGFTRVYRALVSGNGPHTSFLGYLRAAMKNIAIRAAMHDSRLRYEDPEPDRADWHAERDLDNSIDTLMLSKALGELPQRWQTVLWMSLVEGQDTHTIGARLGMSANAAASLTYRAKAGLRLAYLRSQGSPTTRQ